MQVQQLAALAAGGVSGCEGSARWHVYWNVCCAAAYTKHALHHDSCVVLLHACNNSCCASCLWLPGLGTAEHLQPCCMAYTQHNLLAALAFWTESLASVWVPAAHSLHQLQLHTIAHPSTASRLQLQAYDSAVHQQACDES